LENIEEFLDKKIPEITPEELIEFIKLWQNTVLHLDDQYLQDCLKEFSPEIMVGYGIDGDEKISSADFTNVRGNYDQNKFVKTIRTHKLTKKKLGDIIIEKLLLI
jgi:hypothetical protein